MKDTLNSDSNIDIYKEIGVMEYRIIQSINKNNSNLESSSFIEMAEIMKDAVLLFRNYPQLFPIIHVRNFRDDCIRKAMIVYGFSNPKNANARIVAENILEIIKLSEQNGI